LVREAFDKLNPIVGGNRGRRKVVAKSNVTASI